MEEKEAKHICGQCNNAFEKEEQYLNHVCPKLGHTPRGPEYKPEEKKEEVKVEAQYEVSAKEPKNEELKPKENPSEEIEPLLGEDIEVK